MGEKPKKTPFTINFDIPKDMQDRVLDITRPVLTFKDALECAIVGSSALEDAKGFETATKMLDLENNAISTDNSFKQLYEASEKTREEFKFSEVNTNLPHIKDTSMTYVDNWLEQNRLASISLTDTYGDLFKKVNKLRLDGLTVLPIDDVNTTMDNLAEFHMDRTLGIVEGNTKEDLTPIQIENRAELIEKDLMQLMALGVTPHPTFISKFAKKLQQDIEPFIERKPTKPTGSSKVTLDRDNAIRSEYFEMENQGIKTKYIQEALGEKYQLKPDTIRKINFQYGYDLKASDIPE